MLFGFMRVARFWMQDQSSEDQSCYNDMSI